MTSQTFVMYSEDQWLTAMSEGGMLSDQQSMKVKLSTIYKQILAVVYNKQRRYKIS